MNHLLNNIPVQGRIQEILYGGVDVLKLHNCTYSLYKLYKECVDLQNFFQTCLPIYPIASMHVRSTSGNKLEKQEFSSIHSYNH